MQVLRTKFISTTRYHSDGKEPITMHRNLPRDQPRSKQKSETRRNTIPPTCHKSRIRKSQTRARDDSDMSPSKSLMVNKVPLRQEAAEQLRDNVVSEAQCIRPATSSQQLVQARTSDGCNHGRTSLTRCSLALNHDCSVSGPSIEDDSGINSTPSLNSDSCTPGSYPTNGDFIIKHEDISHIGMDSSYGSGAGFDHSFECSTALSTSETGGNLPLSSSQLIGPDEIPPTDWLFGTKNTNNDLNSSELCLTEAQQRAQEWDFQIKPSKLTKLNLEQVYSMSVADTCDLGLEPPAWMNSKFGYEFGLDVYGRGDVMDVEFNDTEVPVPFHAETDYDSPDSFSFSPESSSAGFSTVTLQNDFWLEDFACQMDEQADGKSTTTQLTPRTGENGAERAFACPFLKHSPVEHHKCAKFILRRIQDVKQHIFRHHCGPEIYCPVCFGEFESFQHRDDHIRLKSCTRQEVRRLHISDDQKQALKRKFNSSDPEGRWMELWELIFPGTRRPRSPYVQNGQMELISSFRRYCDDKASKIVARNMQKAFSENFSTSSSMHKFTSIMQQTIHELLDDFEVAS
ncbi:hypothetical protein GGR57DRAFT_469100 [Xylariaceae sp. FL1272]|nr:hypothetical protein GGR57DRAFT_469100 [Xylariaceae sp. FL1272]